MMVSISLGLVFSGKYFFILPSKEIFFDFASVSWRSPVMIAGVSGSCWLVFFSFLAWVKEGHWLFSEM